MKISDKAKLLAEKTSDAYSADRFKNWGAVVHMLLKKGYSEMETEAILRSKWTRWACDQDTGRGSTYGHHTSKALERFIEGATQAEINELVIGTFGALENS